MLLKQKVSFIADEHVSYVLVGQVFWLDDFHSVVQELVDVDLELLLQNLARHDNHHSTVLTTVVLCKQQGKECLSLTSSEGERCNFVFVLCTLGGSVHQPAAMAVAFILAFEL